MAVMVKGREVGKARATLRMAEKNEARKGWIRDAALELLRDGGKVAIDAQGRRDLAYAAVDLATQIWDQVEGRFMQVERG